MRRFAVILSAVLGTLTLVVIAWQLRSIVLLFVASLAIAAAVAVPVKASQERGLPLWLAITLVYVTLIGGVGGLLWAISGPLTAEMTPLIQAFIGLYEASERLWGDTLISYLPTVEVLTTFLVGATPDSTAFVGMVDLTQRFLGLASQLLLALVLSAYWLIDRLRFERLWLSLLAPTQRTEARRDWRALEAEVGSYLRNGLLQSLLVGGLITAGLLVIGAPYPYISAFAVATAWLVPLVGGLIAMGIVTLLAWFGTPSIAALVLLYTVFVFAFTKFFVEPRIYQREQHNAILVLLTMIAMVDAFGLLGLLVAPLVALAVQAFWREFLTPPPPPPVTPTLAKVQERRARLQALLQHAERPPHINNFVTRLDELLTEVEIAQQSKG